MVRFQRVVLARSPEFSALSYPIPGVELSVENKDQLVLETGVRQFSVIIRKGVAPQVSMMMRTRRAVGAPSKWAEIHPSQPGAWECERTRQKPSLLNLKTQHAPCKCSGSHPLSRPQVARGFHQCEGHCPLLDSIRLWVPFWKTSSTLSRMG